MAEVEVKDFAKEVIERSTTIPVLVDFWAEWCAPCRVLGPVLERVVGKLGGRVVLAKVDTDRNPELSMQYGIRGIPAVKLFVDGRVKEEFTGALPEAAVTRWLEAALPGRMQKELDRAAALMAAGDTVSAGRIAREVLDKEPANEEAAVIAARSIIWDEPAQAAELVSRIEEDSAHFPFVEAVRTVARLRALTAQLSTLPEGAAREAYHAGVVAMDRGDFLPAVDRFIEVIRADRRYDDDGGRRACIAIFRLLGDDHEVSRARRRDFSSALNS